jgi:hypothetical protein
MEWVLAYEQTIKDLKAVSIEQKKYQETLTEPITPIPTREYLFLTCLSTPPPQIKADIVATSNSSSSNENESTKPDAIKSILVIAYMTASKLRVQEHNKYRQAAYEKMETIKRACKQFEERNQFTSRGIFFSHIKNNALHHHDLRKINPDNPADYEDIPIRLDWCALTEVPFAANGKRYRLAYASKTLDNGDIKISEIGASGKQLARLLYTYVHFDVYMKRDLQAVPMKDIDAMTAYAMDKDNQEGLAHLLDSFYHLFTNY